MSNCEHKFVLYSPHVQYAVYYILVNKNIIIKNKNCKSDYNYNKQ